MREVCAAFARGGVRSVAASTLFLRPAIIAAIRKKLGTDAMYWKLLGAFSRPQRLAISGGGSPISALPGQARRRIYDRLRAVAAELGLELRICACKNPDISEEACDIAGGESAPRGSPRQMRLFK